MNDAVVGRGVDHARTFAELPAVRGQVFEWVRALLVCEPQTPVVVRAVFQVVDQRTDDGRGRVVDVSEAFKLAIRTRNAMNPVDERVAACAVRAAYAEEVLHVGAVGLGILLAAGALGSVLGTVVVTWLGNHQRGRTLTVVGLLLPLFIAAFAFAGTLWWACVLLVGIGIGLLVLQSLAITLVQVHIDNRVRGRVMTIYSQVHAGSDTMANVLIGGLAVFVGLPVALLLGGGAALFYAFGLRWAMPSVAKLD